MERVQRKSTKFILSDYYSLYKFRLVTLQLLPHSLLLGLLDIVFQVNNFKNPQVHFDNFSYCKLRILGTSAYFQN